MTVDVLSWSGVATLRRLLFVALFATAVVGPAHAQTPGGAEGTVLVSPSTAIAPGDRKYTFQFSDTTYQHLLEEFASQAGLELVGETPQGSISFDFGVEQVDFETALNRMRVVLIGQPGMEALWRDGDKLCIQSVMCTLGWFDLRNTFIGLESFIDANPEDHGIVLLRVVGSDFEQAELAEINLFLPSHVRIVAVPESSSWSVLGIARDVRKYVPLLRMLERRPDDSAIVSSIALEHVPCDRAVEHLRSLFDDVILYEPLRRPRSSGDDELQRDDTKVIRPALSEVRVWRDDAFRRLVISGSPRQMESVAVALSKLE